MRWGAAEAPWAGMGRGACVPSVVTASLTLHPGSRARRRRSLEVRRVPTEAHSPLACLLTHGEPTVAVPNRALGRRGVACGRL